MVAVSFAVLELAVVLGVFIFLLVAGVLTAASSTAPPPPPPRRPHLELVQLEQNTTVTPPTIGAQQ